jgi:hypothetical protein
MAMAEHSEHAARMGMKGLQTTDDPEGRAMEAGAVAGKQSGRRNRESHNRPQTPKSPTTPKIAHNTQNRPQPQNKGRRRVLVLSKTLFFVLCGIKDDMILSITAGLAPHQSCLMLTAKDQPLKKNLKTLTNP